MSTTVAKDVALPSRAMTIAALAAIVIVATALRLLGVTFGLPAIYNPDEIAIMSRALAFASGDLNPHNFLYPTFYFYLLFAWVGGSFVVSWMLGIVPSVAAFQTLFFTDPTNIYLAGRLLGVTCGVLTVVATYTLGKRVAEPGTLGALRAARPFDARVAGAIAALFLAIAPTHVRDSHYVKHDVPVTLAIVLAQIAILRLLTTPKKPPNRGAVLLAGALCGLACSMHYYAVFLAPPLLIAIWFSERRPHGWGSVLARILEGGLAAAIVFFALSPFILVEPRTAWQDIVANRQIVIDRAVGAQHGLFANAGAYARMLWSESIGWPVVLAAIVGLVLTARARPRVALVLLAFPATFLVFISNTVAAGRYLNPVLPTIAALAAVAVVWAAANLFGAMRRPAGAGPAGAGSAPAAVAVVLALLLALILAVPGALLSVRLGLFFRQTDTRTLALEIIERTVPPGATVLVQPYSVPLTQSRESLVEALEAHLGDAGRASRKFAMRLALDPYPAPAYRTIFLGDGGLDVDKIYLGYADAAGPDPAASLAVLRRAGVQYVLLKRYNVEDPAAVPLRTMLRQQGRLLASVSPYAVQADAATRARVAPFLHNTDTPYDPALERPGPGIELWRLD